MVGQGAALAYLRKGYTVVITSRNKERFEIVRNAIAERKGDVNKLHFVLADYNNDANAEKAHADVVKVLGGVEPEHVLVNIGFVSAIPSLASEASADAVIRNLEESIWPTLRANKAFLPPLKADGKRHSYTTLSGGFAHNVFVGALWSATLKNGIANQLGIVLGAELKGSNVSFANICIHCGVAPLGATKNQLGMQSEDTEKFGPYFVRVAERHGANGTNNGTICLNGVADVDKFVNGN